MRGGAARPAVEPYQGTTPTGTIVLRLFVLRMTIPADTFQWKVSATYSPSLRKRLFAARPLLESFPFCFFKADLIGVLLDQLLRHRLLSGLAPEHSACRADGFEGGAPACRGASVGVGGVASA